MYMYFVVLLQAKQRSLGRPFATDTTAEDQQQEISRYIITLVKRIAQLLIS